MIVTTVRKDPEALTMTITAEIVATVERAWQLWADPRQLERWWGPPTYPATFVDHDLVEGGWVSYFMTGPDSDKHHGWWRVVEVDPPNRLVVEDGFARDDGTPNDEMPTGTMVVTLTASEGGGTLMSIESHFPSIAAMEQLIAMGQEEGMVEALGQIAGILADDAA